MKPSMRFSLVLAAVTVVLAACTAAPAASDAPSAPPSTPASTPPSVAPSETAEETPAASPQPMGTLTVADGAAVGGPGIPLADALGGDLSQPVLVRGTLFMDTDGAIYFADSIVDASVPTFGDVRVIVENYPTGGPTWDIDDAEVTGLQEANGVLFFEDTTLYGTISS